MLKISLRILLVLFIALVSFSFYLSPRLGVLIPLGKETRDQTMYHLAFDTLSTNQFDIKYVDHSADSFYTVLRNKYQLDTLTKDAETDFDKILAVQSWVQGRWEHDCCNTPEHNNALYILEQAEKGERFRCVEYSTVARQCLASLGFKVRGLGLMTKDISEIQSGGGHVVNEVYIADLKKWMYFDPQFGVIPIVNGEPLNAIELQYRIKNKLDFDLINPNKTTTKEDYIKWIGPYLYYFTVNLNQGGIGIWDRVVGNKKSLTLYSKDAIQPAYFQKIFRLNTSYYTHSLKDFYPEL
ncbi:transglutaminase-like domain-containing protein [Marivirga arenosa]|uniref:Transglutaminase-like domain-containing protein n=1 Tax=Marivirga arenosa TaxID=3059076 RepID=A0AA51ZXL4_9BACT|nr:transglutaminase-like domain-containing protein [Marivirga sp. BKB1-2]WNB18598.1 transglutaminase-like domain-containing protein [Marivirga sp. BKB1-2]